MTIALVLLGVVLVVALLGRYWAPYGPTAIVGQAYGAPTGEHLFGLDSAGRDVYSRFLWGGRTAVVLAFIATTAGCAIGVAFGLAATYRRGWADTLLMRTGDVLLAFPQLIFILLLLAAAGVSLVLVVVALAVTHAPRVARITRAAALEIVDLPYVESARARGERGDYVCLRELLPNIASPLLVDFGIRLGYSILVVASLSFLGFGLQPPAADWGLMIAENRAGIAIQPWAVVPVVIALALLTISLNMVIDEYRRSRRVSLGVEVRGGGR